MKMSKILAGASVAVLALSGCSMFDHGTASNQGSRAAAPSNTGYSPQSGDTSRAQPMAQTTRNSAAENANAPSGQQNAGAADWRQVQQKLKSEGDYRGRIDGKYGPQTAQALKDFQKSNGFAQTGRLDAETAAKLGISETSGSGSSQPPSSGVNRMKQQ